MKKWIFLIALATIFTSVKAEYKVEYHYVKGVKDYQEVKNFKVNTNKQVTLVYEEEKLQEVPKESPKVIERSFIKTFFNYNEEFYVPRQNETKTIQSMRNKK